MSESVQNISAIEQQVIDYITNLRIKRGLSQADIAIVLNVQRSFIGDVENLKRRAKYNLNHIDKLADHFGLSPRDFLPEQANPHF